MSDEAVEVARITVVKVFDPALSNSFGVEVQYSDGLTVLDGLGMLAFAQHHAYEQASDDE